MRKILSFDIGIRWLALCVVSCEEPEEPEEPDTVTCEWSRVKIEHWELIDLVESTETEMKTKAKPKNAKTINIHQVCQTLIAHLHQRLSWLDHITDILVEQQPISTFSGGKNASGSVRMKIIQTTILSFYHTYYTLNTSIPRPNIESSSPQNKLKVVIDPQNVWVPPLKASEKKTTYQQRKEHTVKLCRDILELCQISPEHKLYFQDKHKQNDLSDCLLQAIYDLQVKTKGKKPRRAKVISKQNIEPLVPKPPRKRRKVTPEITAPHIPEQFPSSS